MPFETLRVMISSTLKDLREHRRGAKEACIDLELVPKLMENLSARNKGGLAASLELVDCADVYVGIVAHRYGSTVEGDSRSITEMEYDRAVEKNLPRFIFIIDKDARILGRDVEGGKGEEALRRFKERLLKERYVRFFKSPEHLRREISNSLQDHLNSHAATKRMRRSGESMDEATRRIMRARLQDLEPNMARFHTEVDAGNHEEAVKIFKNSLQWKLLRSGAGLESLFLLERFFPAGLETAEPRLERPLDRSCVLYALGLSWLAAGKPGLALLPFRRAAMIEGENRKIRGGINARRSYAKALVDCGRLKEAAVPLEEAKRLAKEGKVDDHYGWLVLERSKVSGLCGEPASPAIERILQNAQSVDQRCQDLAQLGQALLAQDGIWRASERDPEDWDRQDRERIERCVKGAAEALKLAKKNDDQAGKIQAYRLRGLAALQGGKEGDLTLAEGHLTSALNETREFPWVEEQIACRIALSTLYVRKGELERARDHLDEIWKPISEGPYKLFEADALNILASLERKAGRKPLAVAAARRAFSVAYCDGSRFTYHWGLVAARRELKKLDVPEPPMKQDLSED